MFHASDGRQDSLYIKGLAFLNPWNRQQSTIRCAVRDDGAVACINFDDHSKRRAAPDVGATAGVNYDYPTVRRAALTEGEVAGLNFHYSEGRVASMSRSTPGKRYQ